MVNLTNKIEELSDPALYNFLYDIFANISNPDCLSEVQNESSNNYNFYNVSDSKDTEEDKKE
ncbi:11119_t:CDS:2, partial [Gigaspora margarita]